MIKKDLLTLRTLKATPKMMEMAKNDKIEYRTYKSWGSTYRAEVYEYSIFMRCQTLRGYLKVVFFLPSHMRCGSNMPVYELFIHRAAGQFLTWDCRDQRWREAMLDNLDWPFGYYRSKIWINPEGAQTIKKYLSVEKTGWDGIIQYQRKVREEQLEQRIKRQTAPWDADLKQTPKLPKDWEKWCSKTAVPDNYIFYEYVKSGAKEGYCTYCDKTVPIEKPAHNMKSICKCCGRKITFKSGGKQKYVHTGISFAYLMQRTKTGFVVREFNVSRSHRQDEQWSANVHIHEVRRAFYDQTAKAISAYRWDLFRNIEHRFCKTDICSYRYYGKFGAVYPRTIPTLTKQELSHTGMPEYIKRIQKIDPESYLSKYTVAPQIEQLVKAGLWNLVHECMENTHFLKEVYDPNIPGGLAKKMGLDEQRLKRLREADGGIVLLEWLRHEKKLGKKLPAELIQYFCGNSTKPATLEAFRCRMSDVQIYNYIRKQATLSGVECHNIIGTWKDTISMAIKYGQNLDDLYFYRPANLRQRHNELVLRGMRIDMEKTAEKNRKEHPMVEGILREIKDIYSYTGETYTVIVPESILDIVIEGKALSHCVANSTRYMERIERRESYIMFLRKTAAPDQAYYTLEVEPDGTVRQKRTLGDVQNPDIEDAKKFLKAWQKVVSNRLTEKEINFARESKRLRLEGFAQMRRDNVRIHTGSLRGRMLVDVLMADLMENEEEKTV